MSKRIGCCVIGGAGFIGAWVVELLAAGGRDVTVVGRRPAPVRPLPAGVRYVSGDYGDSALLERVLPGMEEVIDLAYSSVPKTSFEDPAADIIDNLPPAVNLLAAASRKTLRKLVVVSSGGTVYGPAASLPLTEDHPTQPISPYGITKLAVEKYAGMYFRLYGLPALCVRPGNPYGEGQRPFAAQGFVATAMAAVLTGREVALYGEHGTVRDYLHVLDVARGILAALESGTPGAVYNIGSGIGRSNRQVLDAIAPLAAAQGLALRLKVLPPRGFDVPANVLDSRRLRQVSGWQPGIDLEAGLARTWDWLSRQPLSAGAP